MAQALSLFFEKVHKHSDAIIVVLILAILASMVLPIPKFLLDILLTTSITLSLIILMTTVYIGNPLQISSFPSLLLLATLFRLSLNVATTRTILLHGHEGPEAAGKVIESFGQFVVGGNYIVGVIVFIVLVTINFIVITKGTERISEVGARFTLDAMPGKQMAIDADLNAGIIDEKEAKKRREEIAKEADFYGAMDGASKFIRGDAIAGIIITLINIIGGIAIGVFQHNMDISTAAANFTILTVGDGLVSQIPALITSTAAGLMVTRAVSEANLGKEIFAQLTGYPKALYMGAFALVAMGIVPGMPFVPFMILASMVAIVGYMMQQDIKRKEIEEAEKRAKEIIEETKESEEPEELISQPETITLEIGYSLIPYVDESQNGEIIKRIKSLRKQLSKELGLIIPLVHIKDNLELKPGEYRILIRDIEIAKGEIEPGKVLAIDTGSTKGEIGGIETKEPTFGLKAYWIDESQKDKAKMMGYTVVDIPTVVITHISETIKNHAYEILGRSETKDLVEALSKKYPIVKEIVPEQVSYSILHRVLQNLLREQIPIKDLLSIIEALSDNINKTNDPDILTELVRQSLSRLITSLYAKNGKLYAVTLGTKLENHILEKIKEYEGSIPPLDPVILQQIIHKMTGFVEQFILNQATPVLLTSANLRRYIKKIIEPYLSNVAVLSYTEIDPKVRLNILGKVEIDENQ
ncbi:flagellar biosynthesis protein FlhA [Nitrosophilus kaiyonis]|uniref:flagellar biosynthesis protein FlhA n=1 Tax=Nitrosophilus kaiyonis TaxID=2930200 RepID=UPI0024911345|nr:flagellar biosynthesis protein FlhA [Nitrosophilus kaiyonis]